MNTQIRKENFVKVLSAIGSFLGYHWKAIVIGIPFLILFFVLGYNMKDPIEPEWVKFGSHKYTRIDYDGFTKASKKKLLKESYSYWTEEMTSEELTIRWVLKYKNSVYRKGGRGITNNYDCVSSTYGMARSFGSDMGVNTVRGSLREFKKQDKMYRKLKKLDPKRNRFASKRTRARDVKVGDWIITHGASHMGFVVKVDRKHIRYVDVNNMYKTYGVQSLPFGHKKITGIFSMSEITWYNIKM